MDGRPEDWWPESFSRSPAWRQVRARYCGDRGLPPDPRVDDEWVGVARRVLLGPAAVGTDDAARTALDLWAADGPTRWLLEAQLLTARPFAEVAAACGVPEAVAHAYHQLAFDVRSRPDARDWVLARAVLSTPLNGFAGPQPAGVWKYAAFAGGAPVLDLVVAVTLGRPLPPGLVAALGPDPVPAERRLRLKAKLWIAALTARPDRLGAVAAMGSELDDLDGNAG